MSGYIFRMPAKAYEVPFTYEGMTEFIRKGTGGNWSRKLGTTVELHQIFDDTVNVKLYDTVIARVYADGDVQISENINSHPRQATTAWVQKVLNDNKLPGLVGRVNGKYAQAGKTFKRNV